MARSSVAARLAAQQKAINEANKKLEKIKLDEAKRLIKLFDDVGFFEVDISDDALTQAIKQLVNQASNTPQQATRA